MLPVMKPRTTNSTGKTAGGTFFHRSAADVQGELVCSL